MFGRVKNTITGVRNKWWQLANRWLPPFYAVAAPPWVPAKKQPKVKVKPQPKRLTVIIKYRLWQTAHFCLPPFYVPIEPARPHKKRGRKPTRTTAPPRRRMALTISVLIIGVLGTAYFSFVLFWPKSASTSFDTTPAEQKVIQEAAKPKAMERSEPTHLKVPAIGIDTNMIQLGKETDGTLEVPDDYHVAGWYKYSPTPGEIGPAIIAGHVDNYLGAAVFFRLKDLQIGNEIYVDRADGSTARFKVDAITQYPQDAFPTKEVYGNIDHAGLRLITCGGNFSYISQSYSHNTVIYASLITEG